MTKKVEFFFLQGWGGRWGGGVGVPKKTIHREGGLPKKKGPGQFLSFACTHIYSYKHMY